MRDQLHSYGHSHRFKCRNSKVRVLNPRSTAGLDLKQLESLDPFLPICFRRLLLYNPLQYPREPWEFLWLYIMYPMSRIHAKRRNTANLHNTSEPYTPDL